MSRMPKAVRRSILIAAAGTLAATTIAGVAPAQTTTGAGAAVVPVGPDLRLAHSTDKITLQRYGQRIQLSLGIYAIAGDEGFRIDAHRRSWSEPITAEVVRPGGNVALPDGSLDTFAKIRNFFTLTFTDRGTGDTVYTHNYGFCPAGDAVRVDPNAVNPDVAFPAFCPYNPYTRGAVYGISPGFGLPVFGDYGHSVQMPIGHYTATVTMNQTFADLLGTGPADATSSVDVDVVKNDGSGCFVHSRAFGCKTPTPAVRSKAATRTPTASRYRPAAPADGGRHGGGSSGEPARLAEPAGVRHPAAPRLHLLRRHRLERRDVAARRRRLPAFERGHHGRLPVLLRHQWTRDRP